MLKLRRTINKLELATKSSEDFLFTSIYEV